jgi:hypothetical protein
MDRGRKRARDMYVYIRAMREHVAHICTFENLVIIFGFASIRCKYHSFHFCSFHVKFVSHANFCSSLRVEYTDWLFHQNLFAARFGPCRTFRLFLESSASATWGGIHQSFFDERLEMISSLDFCNSPLINATPRKARLKSMTLKSRLGHVFVLREF